MNHSSKVISLQFGDSESIYSVSICRYLSDTSRQTSDLSEVTRGRPARGRKTRVGQHVVARRAREGEGCAASEKSGGGCPFRVQALNWPAQLVGRRLSSGYGRRDKTRRANARYDQLARVPSARFKRPAGARRPLPNDDLSRHPAAKRGEGGGDAPRIASVAGYDLRYR